MKCASTQRQGFASCFGYGRVSAKDRPSFSEHIKMLHITNGDNVADALVAGGITDPVLPWRDVLTDGPVPNAAEDALRKARSDFLSAQFSDPTAYDGLASRDETLAKSMGLGEDFVLWFEHDLYDQLQIVQILSRLAAAQFSDGGVAMICIDRHPAIDRFIGLGQLTPEQLLDLYPKRKAVTIDAITAAANIWQAFTSATPQDMDATLEADLSSLPFLGNAMRRWREEYPWRQDGLTRTERQIMQTLDVKPMNPLELFRINQTSEPAPFLGDWSFWARLGHMTDRHNPLIACDSSAPFFYPPRESPTVDFQAQMLSLTPYGKAVLRLERDALSDEDQPRWFGGYCLDPQSPHWRWDPEKGGFHLFAA